MNFVVGRSAFVKLVIIGMFTALIGTVALIGNRQKAAASAFGPTPTHTNAPGEANCTACHTGFEVNSGSGEIQISGVPANYSPGQQIEVTVTTTQADAVIYGFQLTAIDSTGQGVGTFSLSDENPPRVQMVPGIVSQTFQRQYVEHTSDGLTNGQFGFNSWKFKWAAPATAVGKVDFYAAGNAANSDGGTSGDYIYTRSVSTMPMESVLVSISGKVFTSAGLPLRNAKVVLTNASNVQKAAISSSFGVYNFSEVPTGQEYTLTVQSKRFRFAPKTLPLTSELTNVDFIGLE